MCGIAGIHRLGREPFGRMDDLVTELLTGIEDRGHDATGFVAINDAGDVQLQKASCRAFYFNSHRSKVSPEARTVLLHTRLATQGKAAFPENNHPVESGGVYAVHNGHIWNDSELFKTFARSRRGHVDSEAIPALVAARGWSNLPSFLGQLEGHMAVAMLCVKHPQDLLLARGNYSPLVYVRTGNLLVWASTSYAIKGAWEACLGTPPANERFRFMQEGDALRVSRGEFTSLRFSPPSMMLALPNAKHYGGGRTLSVQEYRNEKAFSYEDPAKEDWRTGIDTMQCDDCGDWQPSADLYPIAVTGMMTGRYEWLCESCLKWAQEMGIADDLSAADR